MLNHIESHANRNSLEPCSVHYYTKKLQKSALLERQHHRICAQMILNHLQEMGCDQSLLQSLKSYFHKNVADQHLPQPNLDLSLQQIISSKIGSSHEQILQVALKQYIQPPETVLRRPTHAERVSQKAHQILSLNGARKLPLSQEDPIQYMRRLKTCFGHALNPDNQDQEDPFIPVYNIIYDRTGKLLLTGDDMGLIKIWSASNGILLQSLKGHTMAINSMDISFCNKYLASCSNDGLALVWEIQSGRPIAALKETPDDPILVLLYYQQEGGRNYLALASEKGFVYIYDVNDIVKCAGGMLGTQYNQKLRPSAITHSGKVIRLQRLNKSANNGILCMEFNKQGYLAMGTEQGDIIIWDQPDKLMGPNSEKVEWQEHSQECHLARWNKEGTRLLTASYDGTARIWCWRNGGLAANAHNRSETVLKYRQTDSKRIGEITCLAIAWSSKGSYALASFSRKLKKRGDDEKAKTQILVYSFIDNKVINCIDSDNFADIIKLEVQVILLEAHPFLEDIALSADQNGIIILWNVKTGYPNRVFHERGYHMKLPNLEVPILDGCFSPNGLSFVVSSDYGSFSIYGVGVGEYYDQTPTEQFYVSDSEHPIIDESQGFRVLALDSDMEFCFVDRGSICNFYRLPYQYNFHCSFKNQYPHLFENSGKRSVHFQKPKILQYIQTSKGMQIDNRKNEEMFASYFLEMGQTEQKIISDVHRLERDKLLEQYKLLEYEITSLFAHSNGDLNDNNVSESSNHKLIRKTESKEDDMLRIALQKNDNEHFNLNNMKLSSRRRKYIDSDEEEENEIESFRQESQVVATRFRRQQQRSQQQRLQTLTTHRQIRNRSAQDPCIRCKELIQEGAVSCSGCNQKYHKECGEIRLTHYDIGCYCLSCLPGLVRSKPLQHGHRDLYYEDDPNRPQIGDMVVFFTIGYEQYVTKNLFQLDLSKLANHNGRVVGYPGDFLPEPEQASRVICKVLGSYFIFPVQNINLKQRGQQFIIQVFELQVGDLKFNTFYSYDSEQYLILEQVHSHCVRQIRPFLQPNILVQTDQDKDRNSGFQYQFIELEASDKFLNKSDWQIIKCKKLSDDNYQLRNINNRSTIYVYLNYWEIAAVQQSKQFGLKDNRTIEIQGASLMSGLTEIEVEQINKEINLMLKKQTRINYFFYSNVDLNQYREYIHYVPVNCYIEMIQKKLQNNFYRSREELLNDVARIKSNAESFNPKQSEVWNLAQKLLPLFQNIVNRPVVPEERQKQPEISYEIQTRKKKKFNYETFM